MKSPKNHYYYIEVDPSKILNEYHFILCYDRMDGSQDERIELFNSPYPIIMLRDKKTKKIIGILKPVDGETWTIEDERELAYRKYSVVLTGYEHEMFSSICSKGIFRFFPFLSNITIEYALPESDKNTRH